MKRAKFETLEKQREFFLKVKSKLGIGSKKLSQRLNLKSRGSIESYTFMRTAPPVKIIKKLEEISKIKANYQEIEGKIYREKRKFMPLDPKNAEKILKEKFRKDFDYIIKLIKTDLSIKKIIEKIRTKNYSFDNSKISRCIGAYRTNILSKIVSKINQNKKDIIINGHIRKDKKTLSINFNLSPLRKIINKKKIKVRLIISKDRKKIKIIPSTFGRKLIKSMNSIKILITEKSDLKIKSKVNIILNPKEFGFSLTESIYDVDARKLAKEALKEGIIIDPQRSTPNNHKGDLSLYINKKNILLEITQANSYKGAYFKVGQCFIQKISWPNAILYLICKKKFLTKDSETALKKLKVKIINTNFNKGWEKEVIKEIKKWTLKK